MQSELRINLFGFNGALVPMKVGLLGFFNSGRVFHPVKLLKNGTMAMVVDYLLSRLERNLPFTQQLVFLKKNQCYLSLVWEVHCKNVILLS